MYDEGSGPVATDELLIPGETCWRIERADQHAVFVDAAGYFAALRGAVLQAKRRVLFIGWDFDPRIRMDPRGAGRRRVDGRRPDKLGRVLEEAVRTNPELEIGVLVWDYGVVGALDPPAGLPRDQQLVGGDRPGALVVHPGQPLRRT